MHRLQRGTEILDPLAPYLHVDRSRPSYECWVTGHMVAGLDGTAAVGGRVGALSTTPDQTLFRRMRQIADIVLVGAETVRRERYGPVQRTDPGMSPAPPIAVVSRNLTFDWTLSLFADADPQARPLLITCESSGAARRAEAEKFATVIVAGDDQVDPVTALQALADRGFGVVLCEGGPRWLGELVAADRLDELCLSISPLMGGDPLPVSVSPPGAPLAHFELRNTMVEEQTLFLRYERATPTGQPQ